LRRNTARYTLFRDAAAQMLRQRTDTPPGLLIVSIELSRPAGHGWRSAAANVTQRQPHESGVSMAQELVVAHREAAQTAQRDGNNAEANAAYSRELVALAQPAAAPVSAPAVTATRGDEPLRIDSPLGYGPPTVVETLPPAEVDAIFTLAGAWDGWKGGPRIAALRAEWGADRISNASIARSYGDADPGLAALVRKYRLEGHPFVLEAAAMMGRRHLHAAAAASQAPPMSDADRDAHEDELRLVRTRIAEAMSERDTPRANKLYQREQDLIRARQGSRPIVNGQRTA
jgi:hypothetical protein